MRCMPEGLCRLHHYVPALPAVRVSMRFAVLHNSTPLPFSPLALSPHHLLSTLQLSMFSTFPSLLCGFLCQPFLPSNFYWLTNAVRWSWLASTLHKQPACSHHSPLKTLQFHCHTCLHEMKHAAMSAMKHTHTVEQKRPFVNWLLLYTHTDAGSI